MASPIGVSALVADDVIKFVLPTFLGLSLLAPFWNPRISPEVLLFASLFVGFAATPRIANLYLKIVGGKNGALEETKRMAKFHNSRWNYGRLFHAGGKDTQNAITLTDARATLTLMISCYFMVFAVVVLVWSIAGTLPVWHGFLKGLGTAALARVPLILGQEAPAIVCLVIALLIARISYSDYIDQRAMQFSRQYPEAARSLHLESGDVAKAIWGEVTDPTLQPPDGKQIRSPVEGRKVSLKVQENGSVIGTAEVNEFGQFTFAASPYQHIGSNLVAEIDGTGYTSNLTIADRKSVPEFAFIVDASTLEAPPAAPEDDRAAKK